MCFIVIALFSRFFSFFFAFLKTDYVRQLEDVFVEDDDLNEEFHRDTHHIIALPKKNRHSLHHVIEYCLIALLSHSTLKSHCQIFFKIPICYLY